MVYILLFLLILSVFIPQLRTYLDARISKWAIGVGIFNLIIGLLDRFGFLPMTMRLQQTFAGANSKIPYEIFLINIGLCSSLVLIILGFLYKKNQEQKWLFYPVYIIGLISLFITVWAGITVMFESSAGQLLH